MFDGELTPSPGPGLFGIVQDPLGALGELFFGHPQGDQRRIRRLHDFHVILVGKNMLAVKLEDLRFTSDLEKNWAQLGPVCGLVEFFFIILQLQIR